MKPLHLALLLPLTGLLLADAAAAQTDRKLEHDMEFARGVAARFAYVDIAEEVLAELEARNLSGADAEALGLLKCEVYAAAAKAERQAENRLPLYDKALAAYQEFLEANPYSDFLQDAQRSYVDLVNNYGRILEMALEEQVGEDAEATRERIRDVIDGGLELTGALINETAGADTTVEKLERWRLMLNRGQMLLTLANVSEDGSFLYARAESTLEDLALEAGELSGAGLNAYLLLARVKLAQGDAVSASDFAIYVYDVVMPTDPAVREELGWSDLSFEEKSQRWKLAEMALQVCVQALLEQGDTSSAVQYALSFYGDYRAEGFEISPLGYLSLLTAGRALLEAGGGVGVADRTYQWFDSIETMNDAGFQGTRGARRGQSALDLALTIAQDVNDANQGNTLQVRAQKLISEIIERPGVDVDPDILFQAAQGDYYAGDYQRALEAFKGILSRLDDRDEATQQEYAPRVLDGMGQSLAKMNRDLEAAMAFREAATVWQGDPEYDEKVAQGYYKAIQRAKAPAGGDPLLENLYLEAENILKQLDAGGGAIAFRQAERAYGQKDFTQARTLYLQVEPGTTEYEKALVKAALCLYKQKDLAGAKAGFETYLDDYVQNPLNSIVDPKKVRVRAEAMAMATYYLGYIAYQSGEWDDVLALFPTFVEKFPDQDSYGPNALYLAVKAYIAKRDLDGAAEMLGGLIESFPESTATGNAAGSLAIALAAEYDKAAAAGDTDTAQALKRRVAENRGLFNANSSKPDYNSLRQESQLWLELGEWSRAEDVLRRTVAAFGEDNEGVGKHVLPDLGVALLEQKKVPDAYGVLDPLIPREENASMPGSATVHAWCRTVTGWVEGDAQNIVEVPGVGGAEDLELACSLLRKLTDTEGAREKYTAPWYQLKFDTAYGYYQWGRVDSEQTRNALVLIENLQNLTGDTRLDPIADAMGGDDTLRRRFLWLKDQVD